MKKRHLEILGYHVIQVWNIYINSASKKPRDIGLISVTF